MVMRFPIKIIIFTICVVAIAIASLLFVINIKNISITDEKLRFGSVDLMDTAKICINRNGFPHITANNENDLFFAVGYLHAKERLWQMDISRRAGRGELSEIFGKEALNYDMFLRALNLSSTVAETKDVLSKKSLAILEAYTKGINFYIKSNKNKLSFEFGALDYFPQEWRVEDCLIINKMMAFELSFGFYYDITFGEIAASIGKERAKLFVPGYPDESPFVLDDAVKVRDYKIKEIDTSKVDSIDYAAYKDYSIEFNGFSDYIHSLRKFLSVDGSSIGSNCWARRKTANPSSPAILANDPHLSLGLPARWIPMHITSPEINAIGFMLPGLPLIISGRNDNIAWGITNLMLDDCDYFIEKIDNSGKYYFNQDSSKREINFVIDTIKIKNSSPHIYYKRFTERGQIISDAHIFNSNLKDMSKKQADAYLKKNALTYRWIGNSANDDILSMYKIGIARNWSEFTNATDSWSAPALNFTYADKKGNIGIAPSGYVPIRDVNCEPNFPNNAYEKHTGWMSIAKSGVFPKIFNPSKDFVASANNKTGGGVQQYLTAYWEVPSRAERIEELIMAPEEYTVRDAQYMQNDYLSLYAKKIFTYIIPTIDKHIHLLNKEEKEAYTLLKNWDFVLTQNSVAASIYSVFIGAYLYNTFHDELGSGYYYKYLLMSNLALRKLMEISANADHKLFDDVSTESRERRNYIIFKSFKEAIKKCKDLFQTADMKTWRWGQIHQLTLKHRFSESNFMRKMVTVGPFEVGGNSTTINNTEYRISESYEMIVGASMRFIADMGDSFVYISMPGGVSGDPLSSSYSNLVQIWLNGGYLKIPFSKLPKDDFEKILTLEPKLSE